MNPTNSTRHVPNTLFKERMEAKSIYVESNYLVVVSLSLATSRSKFPLMSGHDFKMEDAT